MKKRYGNIIKMIIFAAVYLLLIFALISAEAGAEGASIKSVPTALWYTLTTLTTVGYGDVYPVTAAGKIIGAVFQVLSIGLLAFIISIFISHMRERWLILRLKLRRSRPWYIFADSNARSAALAKSIRIGQPGSVVLFCSGEKAMLTPKRAVELKNGKDGANVFFLGGDILKNIAEMRQMEGLNCSIYCMGAEELVPAGNIRAFDPVNGCARLYWQRFPVTNVLENIVLIGEGSCAEAILEKGLQQNVLASDSHIVYRVFGDLSGFRLSHPGLEMLFNMKEGCLSGDSLIFMADAWEESERVIKKADRIIVCFDETEKTLDTITRLQRYFGTGAAVHANLPVQVNGVQVFGSDEELFTSEIVMQKALDKKAEAIHEIYTRQSAGGNKKTWDQLDGFARESNRAAADHLMTKVWILTKETAADPDPSLIGRAWEEYKAADEAEHTEYRRIEHERWMRFHIIRNWKYDPVRNDGKRQHPLILPFDELTAEDQAKDDYSWELLEQMAASGRKESL